MAYTGNPRGSYVGAELKQVAVLAVLVLAALPAAAQDVPSVPLLDLLQPGLIRQAGCAVRAGQLRQGLLLAHARLRIRPAQEEDWTRMARTLEDAARPLAAECDRAPDPPARSWNDTIAQLRRQAGLLQQAAKAEAALSDMYGKLDPAQKEIVTRAIEQGRAALPQAGG